MSAATTAWLDAAKREAALHGVRIEARGAGYLLSKGHAACSVQSLAGLARTLDVMQVPVEPLPAAEPKDGAS